MTHKAIAVGVLELAAQIIDRKAAAVKQSARAAHNKGDTNLYQYDAALADKYARAAATVRAITKDLEP